LDISEYTYQLPAEKIAIYPLNERDQSKLLVYKNRRIHHTTFASLPDQLPANAFLFFNDTKVIPARLHFKKETGADIEIFLLHPVTPSELLPLTMSAVGSCSWKCAIGNLKRWPSGVRLKNVVGDVALEAVLASREEGLVEFHWPGKGTFAEILHAAGETPLPPYIKRKAGTADIERYQTIYSHFEGAVAAPTAGLHFTETVFSQLNQKKIQHDFLTLHVGAGTFQPIKTENANEHVMHEEQIIIDRRNIENLVVPGRLITAVGTTSLRTLESLYWFGAKLLQDASAEFRITQNDAYTIKNPPIPTDALAAVAGCMDRRKIESLVGHTSLFIKPGYEFKITGALITNFHQPASTLLLLVAAFVGEDWKKIYAEALQSGYRFLSYGDSSLLFRSGA
jgi:S-adenosylmethionine:tRNA ribosyltransferase-isomerase